MFLAFLQLVFTMISRMRFRTRIKLEFPLMSRSRLEVSREFRLHPHDGEHYSVLRSYEIFYVP